VENFRVNKIMGNTISTQTTRDLYPACIAGSVEVKMKKEDNIFLKTLHDAREKVTELNKAEWIMFKAAIQSVGEAACYDPFDTHMSRTMHGAAHDRPVVDYSSPALLEIVETLAEANKLANDCDLLEERRAEIEKVTQERVDNLIKLVFRLNDLNKFLKDHNRKQTEVQQRIIQRNAREKESLESFMEKHGELINLT